MNIISMKLLNNIWEKGFIPIIITLLILMITIILTIVFVKKEININRKDDKK